MLMRIKYFLLICFSFVSLWSNENRRSLIGLIEPYKNSYIKTDASIEALRAFDLWTGNTSTTGVSFTNITGTFNQGSGAGSRAHMHPTGKWISVAGGSIGFIYDISVANTAFYHLNPQNTIAYPGDMESMRWHPTGKYLAYGGSLTAGGINGRVVFFDTKTGLQTRLSSNFDLVYGGVGSIIYACTWHPSGKYLTIAGTAPSSDLIVTYSFDEYSLYKISNRSNALFNRSSERTMPT